MTKHHYAALKARLTSQIPGIAHVDWYMGQDDPGDGETWVWKTPAAYIEFAPVDWVTLGGNVQRGLLVVTVRLVTDGMGDGDKALESPALEHFDFLSEVFRALQGFRANLSTLPQFAPLAGTGDDRILLETVTRINSRTTHESSNLLRSEQTFSCICYDYAAVPAVMSVLATINISQQFELLGPHLTPKASPPTPPDFVTLTDSDGDGLTDESGAVISEE